MTPKAYVLATHFFFVACHAVWNLLFPCASPARMRRAYNLLHVACIIIMPHLAEERVTVLATWPLLLLTNLLFPWRNHTLTA